MFVATLDGILGRLAEATEKSRRESATLAAKQKRESDEVELLQARFDLMFVTTIFNAAFSP